MKKVLAILLAIFLAVVVAALLALPAAGLLYAVYTYVLLSIIPTLPALTFWQMYFLFWALATIANLFRTKVTTD